METPAIPAGVFFHQGLNDYVTHTVTFALSTHWNACQHTTGESLVEEILTTTGLSVLELGYDVTLDLVPGIMRMVAEKAIRVDSVHNFCPVPVGAPFGHPELFVLASLDRRTRDSAVRHTTSTIEFAARVGAKVVVCHAGNVNMTRYTRRLVQLALADKIHTPKFERIRTKLIAKREKRVPPYLEYLTAGIEALLPVLEGNGVALAFENLPTWESIPTEIEIERICRHFNSPYVRAWHDIGHGRIRQNLGFTAQKHWIGKLAPWLAGFHVHDVIPPAQDHVMPPDGAVDFAALAPVLPPGALLVLEPAPRTPAHLIRQAVEILNVAWPAPALPSPAPPETAP